MPERNEPPELDHDRLIEVSATVKHLVSEVDSLRDWRHDTVAPVMMHIQAQQKTNADAIGRLTENIGELTRAISPLAGFHDDFRTHTKSDEQAFDKIADGLGALHEKINGSRIDLSEKIDENRAESAKGHRAVILWIAGMLLTALGAMAAGGWAFISPHLVIH